MIRNTHQRNPQGTVVAYADNAAVIEGATDRALLSAAQGQRLWLCTTSRRIS